MVRCLSKRWGVAVVAAAALSAGAGVVEAATTVDMADLYPECRGVPEYIGKEGMWTEYSITGLAGVCDSKESSR